MKILRFKSLKELGYHIFGSFYDFPLEQRLFISTCFFGIIVGMLAGIIDLGLQLGYIMVLFPMAMALIFFVLYYFSRFKGKFKYSIWTLIILALFALSFAWFFNAGYDGPITFVILDAFMISLIIAEKKSRKYILLMYLIVLSLIFAAYYFKPEIFENYQFKEQRFFDLLLTVSYCIVIMYFIINYVVNNYHFERAKVEKEKKEVSKINAELIDKQNQLETLNSQLLEKNNQINSQKIELEALNTSLSETNRKISLQNIKLEYLNSELKNKNLEVETQREKSEKLLLNVMPKSIADRLKDGEITIADHFEEASVVFIDIVDFTRQSSGSSPESIVELLNNLYTEFDRIAEKHGLEKIKTIGDCYMAAAGIPEPREDHALQAAKFALEAMDIQLQMTNGKLRAGKEKKNGKIQFRCGIDSGPVVAGVIGEKKFIYDLWGDTVNTASRMEEYGEPDMIQCTERFKNKLTIENGKLTMKKGDNNFQLSIINYQLIERGEIEIKGKGIMRTWFLENNS